MPIGVASAADCPDIEVVFARGTNDAPGLGNVGRGEEVVVRGVIHRVRADGANDASGHIQFMADNCPDTRLVLGGYSQGAAVIDVISAVPMPVIGFNSPLPPNVPDHVAAIAVFGNPSAKLGLPLTVSPVWGGRSIDLCNGGDPICQTDGESLASHRSYVGGPTNQAANFAAGLL